MYTCCLLVNSYSLITQRQLSCVLDLNLHEEYPAPHVQCSLTFIHSLPCSTGITGEVPDTRATAAAVTTSLAAASLPWKHSSPFSMSPLQLWPSSRSLDPQRSNQLFFFLTCLESMYSGIPLE